MEKIIEQIIKRLDDLEKQVRELKEDARPIKRKEASVQAEKQNSDDLILSIVNKIGDCVESEEIQSKILDQKGMEAKILLCFYISYKYFKNEWLTTGDIERITSGLGIKITVGNVSNKIREEIRKYLEGGSRRKIGQPTPYRLNRKGVKYFEEIIHASKEIKKPLILPLRLYESSGKRDILKKTGLIVIKLGHILVNEEITFLNII